MAQDITTILNSQNTYLDELVAGDNLLIKE